MKLGPLFWIGIEGLSLSAQEKQEIKKTQASGIILFKRNIESLSGLFKLCQEIHSLESQPLIIIDREGGAVDRLRHLPEFLPWPSPWDLARTCSLEEIEKTAFYKARELKALGICASFAPCLDILSVPNPLFEGRLLGCSSLQIGKKALAYMRGLRRAGLATSAKHFPGHGGVREDSHLFLPVDQRDLKSLEKKDILPFQQAIDFNVDMIMTAHVLYSKVDPAYPATLSEVFLKKLLREKMKFKGLVVSDDLDMGALRGLEKSLPQLMARALFAGVDVLLKCAPCKNFIQLLRETEKLLNSESLSSDLSKKTLEIATSAKNLIIQEKLFRLNTFREKYKNIKPVSSLEELKKIISDPEPNKWHKTLTRRAGCRKLC